MFYANEHEPVHVHGKRQGRECRAELMVLDGIVVDIQYKDQPGRQPLSAVELRNFQEIVSAKAEEIVQKWIDFFVLHRPVQAQKIDWRLK